MTDDLSETIATAGSSARARRLIEMRKDLEGFDWGDALTQPVKPQVPQEKPGWGQLAWNSLARGTIGELGMVSGLAGVAGTVTGSEETKDWGRGLAEWSAKVAEPYAPSETQKLLDEEGLHISNTLFNPRWMTERVLETVPGLATFLIPGIGWTKGVRVAGRFIPMTAQTASRLAGIGSKVASGATFGAMEMGGTFEEVRARGGSDREAAEVATLMGLVGVGLGVINLHYIMGEGGGILKRFGRGALSTALIDYAATGARAAVMQQPDTWEMLRDEVNRLPGLAIGGGVAATALGRPRAKPAEAAPKVGAKPAEPSVDPRTEKLRQDFQAKMTEAKQAEAPPAKAGTPEAGAPAAAAGEPAWVAEQRAAMEARIADQRIAQHRDFGSLVFFLLDGKRGTSQQRADASAQASAIIASNPQGTIADFIPVALRDRAAKIAPERGAPPIPTEPTAETVPAEQGIGAPGAGGKDVGLDSKQIGDKVVLGADDSRVISEMEKSIEAAKAEPLSGKRVPVPAGEEVSSKEVSGGIRFIGSKTMKPDWMRIEGTKNDYYSPDEVLKVLEKLKRGKWPKTARQVRIADQIEQAIRLDAEVEKGLALGVAPEARPDAELPRAVDEAQIKTGFFADVERLAQEQAAAEVAAAEGLSDWQRSMLDQAEQIVTAPAPPPEAPRPPRTLEELAATMKVAEERPVVGVGEHPVAEGEPKTPPPKLINLKYVNATDHIKQGLESQLREFSAETWMRMQGIKEHEQSYSEAFELLKSGGMSAERLVLWPGGKGFQTNAEVVAGKSLAVFVREQAERVRSAVLRGEDVQPGLLRQMELLSATVSVNYRAALGETGRALEAAKIKAGSLLVRAAESELAGGAPEPEAVRRALEAAGPNVDERQLAEMIQALPKETVDEFIIRSASWSDMTLELFYGSRLGPISAVRAFLGNASAVPISLVTTRVAEAVSPSRRAMEAKLLDGALGRWIRPDRVAEADQIVRGEAGAQALGVQVGLQKAWSLLKTSVEDAIKVAKAEGTLSERVKGAEEAYLEILKGMGETSFDVKWEPKITGDNLPNANEMVKHVADVLGVLVRLSPTANMTADVAFKVVADLDMAYRLAHRAAVNEGATGDRYAERVQYWVEHPSDAMLAQRREYRDVQTFTKPFDPGTFLGKTQATINAHPFIRMFVIPFFRTTVRLAEYAGQYTPVLQHAMSQWQADFNAGGSRRDIAVAKMAIGWSWMAAMGGLALAGVATGAGPFSRNQRDLMEQNGWKRNTFLGVSIEGMEPLSALVGLPATFVEVMSQAPQADIATVLGAASVATGEYLFSRRFLMGASTLMDAIRADHPEAQITAAVRLFTPPLPMEATLRGVRRSADELMREAHGMLERYANAIPGLSSTLPPQRNWITGDPLPLNAWGPDWLSAFSVSGTKPDPVLDEIVRLRGAGMRDLPWTVQGSRPPTFVRMTPQPATEGVNLEGHQRDRWAVLATQVVKDGLGQNLHTALSRTIASPEYAAESDDLGGGKATILAGTVQAFRQEAFQRLLQEDVELRSKVMGMQVERAIRKTPTAQQPAARERAAPIFAR